MGRTRNLIQRGYVYYWRGRLPNALDDCMTGRHATLSLRTRDRDAAERMARRLTLLRDETIAQTAGRITPEALQRIIERERDSMVDHLERLKVGPKRRGNADFPRQVTADITIGWVYRLLSAFGANHPVESVGSETARQWLERNGAPTGLIEDILWEAGAERQRWRSPRLDYEIASLLKELSLEDTPVHRERLTGAIFDGRAEALLAVEGRYPAVDPEQVKRLLEGLPATDPAPPETTPALTCVADTPLIDAADVEADRNGEADRYGEPSAMLPSGEVKTASPDQPAPGVEAAPRGPVESDFDKPVADMISTAFRGWKNRRGEKLWGANDDPMVSEGFRQHRQAVLLFQRVLEHAGIERASEIRQNHVAEFRVLLGKLYIKWGNGLRKGQPYPTVAQLLNAAEMRRRQGDTIGLDVNTVRRHMGSLGEVLGFLRAEGLPIVELDTASLTPPKKGADGAEEFARPSAEGKKLSASEVARFTRTPVFTGCAGPGEKELAQPGPHHFHSGLNFIPVLLLYTGARRSEIAALEVDDVCEANGIPHIAIRRMEEGKRGRGLKNANSRRLVPLHREILRLNFLAYVEAIRARGHRKLFPEFLNLANPKQDMGDVFYKKFTRLMRAHEKSTGDPMTFSRHYDDRIPPISAVP